MCELNEAIQMFRPSRHTYSLMLSRLLSLEHETAVQHTETSKTPRFVQYAGRIALRLQPRALDYAASRLRSLEQLQATANTPLKDVSGSDIRGVHDYLRLEKLAQLLAHVRCLKIESALPGLR